MSAGAEQVAGHPQAPAETDHEPLTPAEIQALVSVYNTPSRAEVLLRSAGYPAAALPYAPATLSEYWEQVSLQLTAGVMARGRSAILDKARERHPYNPVFSAAGPAHTRAARPLRNSEASERLRVMVLGAEPARRGTVRAAAELREIQAAAPDRLQILVRPAATADDLADIRRQRPDILHLACHGAGGALLLEDADGEAHILPAADLVATLRLATDNHGLHLHALLLRSCDSAEIADLFTGVADVVIAHRGPLDADCSTLFASAFYRELAAHPAPPTPAMLDAVAHTAAQDVVNRAGLCRSLRSDLIVLPRTPEPSEAQEAK
ncbi:effector-associated domain EAD1-containing protein [Streptomyces sp. NPDC049915]|uniref:effector-associated domain EAD1-containing protein n=1 Tax=Streptomyces sp. NPDC049915 TaxID=3155510 RepID=UPI00344A5AAD